VRLVAVADTHLFHRELVVPDGDVFIHAGDLCRAGNLHELALSLDWIAELPHPTKLLVAGNHDWSFVRERAKTMELLPTGITYLEDGETRAGELRVWGSPWQPEFNDWAFNLPRGAALAERWALIPEGIDVLVTHGPAEGIGDRTEVGGRHGCSDLLARVREVRPRLHLFGHIHEDGGAWRQGETLFCNVTTWECERAPTVVDIDERTGEASPVSVPPRR
jgi:predicted phosphodiesterase